MGFRFRDSFSFPYASAPASRYTVSGAGGAAVSGGVMSVSGVGTTTVMLAANGQDHVYTSPYLKFKVPSKTAVLSTALSAILLSSGGAFYSVGLNLLTGAMSIVNNLGSLLAATLTLSPNDVLFFDTVRSGAAIAIKVYQNGALVQTVTDATAVSSSGQSGWSCTNLLGGTITFDDLDMGESDGTGPSQLDSIGPYTGYTFGGSISRIGLFCSSYDGGESDTQGQCADALWNPGGGTSDWAGYLSSSIGQYLKYGYSRVVFRGPGGNNSLGCVFGDTYTTAGSPTPGQCVSNILGLRFCDLYRNTTDSGFTTVMSDGRLLDNFQTAWRVYLSLLDEIKFYHCLPPNGVKKTGSAGGTPTAYTNSSTAFDEWDQELLNLGAVSTRAGVSIAYDTMTSSDPGGSAGSLPANNVLAKAYTDWLVSGRTHRSYGEPHPTKGQGGTNANLAYYPARFGAISVTNPTLGSDRARQVVLNPGDYYGPPSMGSHESIAWVDGTWAPEDRFGIASFMVQNGWSVFIEPSGLSPAQHSSLVRLGERMSGTRTGRVYRIQRTIRA